MAAGEVRRNAFGREYDPTTRRAGRRVTVRTDLTHVYSTETGQRPSLQGMRCKIVIEKKGGSVIVEFENGKVEAVHIRSLKRLPS